jgi:hypothetical protein
MFAIREAQVRAVGAAQRRHDFVDPEARAVLADAPAFVFGAPGRQRALHVARRLIGIVREVEDGHVPAENLVLGVALEPARAFVPAGDAAVSVECEQLLVDDAFEQHAQPVVAGIGGHPPHCA